MNLKGWLYVAWFLRFLAQGIVHLSQLVNPNDTVHLEPPDGDPLDIPPHNGKE